MSENLTRIIDAFQGRKILVIGDMVADVYLDGRISRISREAPVLVLQQAGERIVVTMRQRASRRHWPGMVPIRRA